MTLSGEELNEMDIMMKNGKNDRDMYLEFAEKLSLGNVSKIRTADLKHSICKKLNELRKQGLSNSSKVQEPLFQFQKKVHEYPNEQEKNWDSKTVIDMSFSSSTNGDIEDKQFNKFNFLVQAKQELETNIAKTLDVISKNREHLDESDLSMLNKLVGSLKHKLQIGVQEMYTIHKWFSDNYKMKRNMYEKVLAGIYDPDGNATTHFKSKVRRIDEYMKSLSSHFTS